MSAEPRDQQSGDAAGWDDQQSGDAAGWDDQLSPTVPPDVGTPDDPERTQAFPDLPSFVTGFLLPHWRRPNRAMTWCPRWWEHHEAVLRLEAIWDAFEALRWEPGVGVSTWLLHHLDPHMRSLTDRETTPFHKCDAAKGVHVTPEPWPSEPPPPGMFISSATH